ncbi:anhydro-N-acetylmuramic acid kinase [Roseitranquillus sediminis]|uniref:anhydro-N-acetylmuramic acid kinase n=1 Tax=Roseitranquillus sediminis TaxID=2809051 RepID=UPI001D0CB631|nr:anhydro-N-acetylmuramic acid kinase [Roseitranquillus sediminis]MBM9596070.1 anhydro-N-acetylmuramic acid kinase [Roseitranquillus sediminis]
MTVLGAMSGTSLDGVDAAVLVTDGEGIKAFGPSAYRPYTPEERAVLRAALGRWPGDGVEEAARVVTEAHLDLMRRFDRPDLAGFHGQTLAHEPRGRGTHQAGDAAGLARGLGVPVAWDFRSADVAAGGEGAPFAPFFHFACARWAGLDEPTAFLNLGGVGNLTWVDPAADGPDAPGACLAFDTGPANAPMDDLVRARTTLAFDEGGALAAAGRVDEEIVERFLAEPYLARPAPKSLDRLDFAWLWETGEGRRTEDAVATLAAVAAAAVAQGLDHCPSRPRRMLVTGGGRRNPTLMAMLADRAAIAVEPVEAIGLDGDMLEAQAFAYLAARVARGLPLSAPGTTGVPRPLPGGRICRP